MTGLVVIALGVIALLLLLRVLVLEARLSRYENGRGGMIR